MFANVNTLGTMSYLITFSNIYIPETYISIFHQFFQSIAS